MVEPGSPKLSKRNRDRQNCRGYLSKDDIEINNRAQLALFRYPDWFSRVFPLSCKANARI